MTKDELLTEYNLRTAYRNTFLSEDGKIVLQHLAIINAVFSEEIKSNNPEMIGRGNAVKGIFNMLASLDDIPLSVDNGVIGLIRGLTSVPILAHTNINNVEDSNE